MPPGNDLTYKIIGCTMKVHNKMHPGFQEVIYQRCLAIELEQLVRSPRFWAEGRSFG